MILLSESDLTYPLCGVSCYVLLTPCESSPKFEEELGRNKLCRQKKSLYGLKQSPRAWFEQFGTMVKGLGYIQSQDDHTLLYKHLTNSKIAILIL